MSAGRLLLLVGLLIGCGARWEVLDEDGDGYSSIDGDCDDTDPDVLPGAQERCDGIDNDCSGLADDLPEQSKANGALSLYRDTDGDSFGDPLGFSGRICVTGTIPGGMATNALDCDDSDDRINPSMSEHCDGVDNNCNDAVDEGCDSGGSDSGL